jgi:hypothetical protein
VFWSRALTPVLLFSLAGLGAGCELFVEDLPEPIDESGIVWAGGSNQSGSGGASAGRAGAPGGASGDGGDPAAGGASFAGGAPSGGTGAGGDPSCPMPCDCDADGARDESGQCGGADCDDHDPLVKPGQKLFFTTPSSKVGFDYDCSKTYERDPSLDRTIDCLVSLGQCEKTFQAYLADVPECGKAASWGTCKGTIACEKDPRTQQTMACR